MNRKHVDKLLAKARDLRAAITPPRLAWEDALDAACDQLDCLDGALNEESCNHLLAVLADRCRQVQYADGFPVFNVAQSAMFVRWLDAFPRMLSLTDAALRPSVLADLAAAITVDGRSWFKAWLRDISLGTVRVPADVTAKGFKPIVEAILANPQPPKSGAFTDDMPAYCAGCTLFCPMRMQADRQGRPWRILTSCPHCGDEAWRWSVGFDLSDERREGKKAA